MKPRRVKLNLPGSTSTTASPVNANASRSSKTASSAAGNDPRMVTLSGMRRRGYPAAAIRDFCERIGVSKAYSVVDYGLLESCVRDRLNADAPRAMAVLHPLRVIIDNYPEGQTETIEVENNPDRPELGTRHVTFSRRNFMWSRRTLWQSPVRKNISASSPATRSA